MVDNCNVLTSSQIDLKRYVYRWFDDNESSKAELEGYYPVSPNEVKSSFVQSDDDGVILSDDEMTLRLFKKEREHACG